MLRRRLTFTVVLLAATIGGAAPAAADHHLMRVTEVFGGAAGNPNAQFIELQMYAPGQHFVNGTGVRFLTPAGTADGTFGFTSDLPNGADNATVLVATPEAASFFGLTPDLLMSPVMDRAGGKLEFVGKTNAVVDRFSWGNYSGVHTGSGTPFPGGLPLGVAAVRDVSEGTVAHQLDAADDTGDSANDFFPNYPSPTTNAGQTGTSRQTIVKRFENGALQVEASLGVKNAITVSQLASPEWKITETGAPIKLDASAESTCTHVSVTEVNCAITEPRLLLVYGFDLDDTVNVNAPISSTVMGGTGNDKLTGGGRDDALHGEEGHDRLTGNHGNDDLVGLSGNELMNGGNGADDFDGGTGIDTATYATRTGGLTIDMDGSPDDGNAFDASGGRRDDVQTDVEWLTGGKGADRLTGNGSANRIVAGAGADQVFGLGGADNIFVKGDGAADSVDCGSEADRVSFDTDLDTFAPNCETVTP